MPNPADSQGVVTLALRTSPAETQNRLGGSAITASTVRSETQHLRFAYPSVEGDVVATGGDATNYFSTTGS